MADERKVVYLSGPMTGKPDWNFPAFHQAAKAWQAEGWAVINPAENFGGQTGHPRHEYMRVDIGSIQHCTAIAVLPGWSASEGAREEVLVATSFGLPLYDAISGEEMLGYRVVTSVVVDLGVEYVASS